MQTTKKKSGAASKTKTRVVGIVKEQNDSTKTNYVPDPSDMYPISVLAKKLPHGVGYAAITAWIATGRESVSGKLVKMKSWKMPFGRASTVQAYREFIEALNH